mmetsp:Transcript_2217/g.2846  ORF Transcript_2217/g.2846 Transcript_2217/m.2846 type:complete len:298 (+) Transcript_2217:273-1166(+)|eukprot:CAMPEP_0172507388 /NCGR_PEP_ID=MMETSP1066-20121228/203320_1 /TAXON_ID=671091 /ORGANISM="Coscinodiscus wailesii, Strain CCMP2513" /LENGTH=297 /DNA_ID=CAMNT_0013284927 /DNA_START=272 /DNA_END=1165 /DNA_ORIENTATION=+
MSKSPSLRRIQADVRELAMDPSDRYHAAPLEEDMFEWHFTIRGADDTDFAGGIYHGRILLPPEYPFKPPHIMFLTPSGRFETNTKICLSFSAYHPELWQPAWGIRLILEALISFLPTPADGAIGALDWTSQERKRLAKESVKFCCARCGVVRALLPEVKGGVKFVSRFQKEIDELMIGQKVHEIQNETQPEKEEEEEEKNNDPKRRDESPMAPPEQSQPTVPPVPTAPVPVRAVAVTPAVRSAEESQEMTRVAERSSWLTDPVVHGSIVTFAAIVFLLYRKVDSLLYELRSLDQFEN